MISIADLPLQLQMDEQGIWRSQRTQRLSYPEAGNQLYYQLEDHSFWLQHRNEVLSEIVKQFPPTGIFFDIGGGNGCVANALQSLGIDVVLLEPGPVGALNAKKRGVKHVICSTLEDAGLPQGSIPSAGLFDVIEHIEDDRALLKYLRTRMQQGGLLYVTVPAFNLLWSHEDVEAGHFRRMTVRQLKELAEQTGFQVEYCTYFFSFLTILIFLLRSIPSALGFRKQSKAEKVQQEHRPPSGIVGKWMEWSRQKELERIHKKQSMFWGSSCLLVARAV
jgi:SAM-dependent methyltransferase